MDRFRVAASYSVSLQQRPTFPTTDSIPSFPTSREPHFPSHLRPLPLADDVHRLRRLAEDTELSIFDAERYFNEGADHLAEIAAVARLGQHHKRVPAYNRADDPPSNHRDSSVSSLDSGRRSYQTGSAYATPTASSEASWNSRSGLLSNTPGSVTVRVRACPHHEQRKGSPSSSSSSSSSACRWFFRRRCPCSGKGAVEVQDKNTVPTSPTHSNLDSTAPAILTKKVDPGTGEACGDEVAAATGGFGAVPTEVEMGSGVEMAKVKVVVGNQDLLFLDPSHRRIVHSGKPFKESGGPFSFPVLQQAVAAAAADDPPRHSLEVFRPSDFNGTRRSHTFPPSPKTRVAVADMEDDVASDSSSDLFEIESLSTQVGEGAPYGRRGESLDEVTQRGLQLRRSLEEPASVAASECYPPSEVSVEWSVATAEGGFGPGSVANFSSAASDCEGAVPEAAGFGEPEHRLRFPPAVLVAGAGGGKRRGGGGGLLLGCRCEKAVSVGPHPVRFDADHHQGGFPPEAGRARATAAHLSKPAGATPARLARSRSERGHRLHPGL